MVWRAAAKAHGKTLARRSISSSASGGVCAAAIADLADIPAGPELERAEVHELDICRCGEMRSKSKHEIQYSFIEYWARDRENRSVP